MPDAGTVSIRCDNVYCGGCKLSWLEHQIVALGAVGSSPIIHPKLNLTRAWQKLAHALGPGSSGFPLGVQVPPRTMI